MENTAIFLQLEQNSVSDLEVLPANQELPQPHGIPATDTDLTKAFILKSHSSETRRIYKITLQTFSRFCQLRHGRKTSLVEVTFTDITAWHDWLIKEGKGPHKILTKLAILRSHVEYGRTLGILN